MEKIIELLKAYGYEIEFEDKNQNKIRFSNEERFIDVWDGKRGITIGFYNPETKQVGYYRNGGLEKIERLIVESNIDNL